LILDKVYRRLERIINRVKSFISKLPINGLIEDSRSVYVLKYPGLTNIGDEVQSIATKEIINRLGFKVKYVSREKLSKHFSFFKRRVILNGWFSHDPSSFPPSRALVPIFVGFHLANLNILKSAKSIDYFKKNQPIGCRDLTTVGRLEESGVNAYYTACPTITLQRRNIQKRYECLVVDAHLDNPDGHTSDARDLMRDVIARYNIENVQYVSQNCQPKISFEDKFKLADMRLDELASSKIVITNRIHVALPCLGMGVPVIFVHSDPLNDARISSFLPFFWYKSSTEENLPDVNDYNEIKNKNEHEYYKNFIEAKINELLN